MTSLFLEERRRAIVEQLEKSGRVTVKLLSDMMDVSEVTIRQDLRALEEQGVLERTYGGAVYRGGGGNLTEMSFKTRLMTNRAKKEALAAAATHLIHDGHSIALDSSTTVYVLAPYLRKFNKLTIVTNGLMAAQTFLGDPERQTRVLLPGGRLRSDAISVVGQSGNLPDVNLHIGFFSSRGISEEVGASEVDPDEVLVKQALIERCMHTVFLIDGSKWGKIAPYTIVPPGKIEHIITTDDAPSALVDHFRSLGTQVDIVTPEA